MTFIIGFGFCVLIIIISLICGVIQKRTIVEGIIIGLLSGLLISFFTDANIRAEVAGPIIKCAKKINKQLKYSSQNWTNISTNLVNDGFLNVSATNIASGVTVTFNNEPLTSLPADLRYDIATGDTVKFAYSPDVIIPEVKEK